MRTMTRSTRLASILLPAFLYLGCTGEGLTGPTAVDDRTGEETGAAAADDRGHVTPRGPAPAEAEADQCIYWDEEMFCPSTGNGGDWDLK